MNNNEGYQLYVEIGDFEAGKLNKKSSEQLFKHLLRINTEKENVLRSN